MIADIFYPIFTLITCFIKKKLFGGFALMPLPGHYPGPPVGLTAPPRPPVVIIFGFAKNRCDPIFLYYPLKLYLKVAENLTNLLSFYQLLNSIRNHSFLLVYFFKKFLEDLQKLPRLLTVSQKESKKCTNYSCSPLYNSKFSQKGKRFKIFL